MTFKELVEHLEKNHYSGHTDYDKRIGDYCWYNIGDNVVECTLGEVFLIRLNAEKMHGFKMSWSKIVWTAKLEDLKINRQGKIVGFKRGTLISK